MVKLVVLLARREGMSREAFELHARYYHLLPITQLPGLRRLLVNRVLPDPSDPAPAYDAVAELWFDDYATVSTAFASPTGEALLADAPAFLDLTRFHVLFVAEESVPLPTGPGLVPAA
jgi:uncharacterized protein (TIGR02118 family)